MEQLISLDYIQKLIKGILEYEESEIITTDKTVKYLKRSLDAYNAKQSRLESIREEDNYFKNFIKQEASHIEEAKYWNHILYEKIPEMYENLEK